MSDETQAKRVWHALEVTIEPAAREAVEYALMEAGALGTEVLGEGGEFSRLVAYFDRAPEREQLRAALFAALRIYNLPFSSGREMGPREVLDQDWRGEWKRSWQPTRVGRRFVVAPPW